MLKTVQKEITEAVAKLKDNFGDVLMRKKVMSLFAPQLIGESIDIKGEDYEVVDGLNFWLVNQLSADMTDFTMPLGTQWMEFRTKKENEFDEAETLDEATERFMDKMNTLPINAVSTVADQYAVAGGDGAIMLENNDKKITLNAVPINELYWRYNDEHIADTVARHHMVLIKKLVQIYPKAKKAEALKTKKDGDSVEIVEYIYPSDKKPNWFTNCIYFKDSEEQIVKFDTKYNKYIIYPWQRLPNSQISWSPCMQEYKTLISYNALNQAEIISAKNNAESKLHIKGRSNINTEALRKNSVLQHNGDIAVLQTGGATGVGERRIVSSERRMRESYYVDKVPPMTDQKERTKEEVIRLGDARDDNFVAKMSGLEPTKLVPLCKTIAIMMIENDEFDEFAVTDDNKLINTEDGREVEAAITSGVQEAYDKNEAGKLLDGYQRAMSLAALGAEAGVNMDDFTARIDHEKILVKISKLTGLSEPYWLPINDLDQKKDDEVDAVQAEMTGQVPEYLDTLKERPTRII